MDQQVQAETVIRVQRRQLDEANFQVAVLQAQLEELGGGGDSD